MPVLITNLDMPNACINCPMHYDEMLCSTLGKSTIWDGENGDALYESGFDSSDARLPDCPLINVDVDIKTFIALCNMAKQYNYLEVSQALSIARRYHSELDKIVERMHEEENRK